MNDLVRVFWIVATLILFAIVFIIAWANVGHGADVTNCYTRAAVTSAIALDENRSACADAKPPSTFFRCKMSLCRSEFGRSDWA